MVVVANSLIRPNGKSYHYISRVAVVATVVFVVLLVATTTNWLLLPLGWLQLYRNYCEFCVQLHVARHVIAATRHCVALWWLRLIANAIIVIFTVINRLTAVESSKTNVCLLSCKKGTRELGRGMQHVTRWPHNARSGIWNAALIFQLNLNYEKIRIFIKRPAFTVNTAHSRRRSITFATLLTLRRTSRCCISKLVISRCAFGTYCLWFLRMRSS